MILWIVLGTIALALIALWLFFIGAKHSSRMKRFATVKYAHRGLHGNLAGFDTAFAENSLGAFRRAVELGFGIELDVRCSGDGVAVVFHDSTLDRVCGVSGKVSDFTAEELSKIHLSGTEDTVPTFREVLDLVGGKVPLLVEIKEEGFDHSATEQAVKLLSEYSGEYIVESFSPLSLGVVKKLDKRIIRGFLLDKLSEKPEYSSIKYRIIQRQLLSFIARPHFIAANHKRPKLFPTPLVRAIFRPDFIAYTIRSEEEEKAAYKNGFTGVIFENYIPEKTRNED